MNNGINLSYANIDSPSTGPSWVKMNSDKRISLIETTIQLYSPEMDINVIDAHENGQVSIHINSSIEINDRGAFLLNLEEYLKSKVDVGINLWHEALGDKSSLRNLRGIEVLS